MILNIDIKALLTTVIILIKNIINKDEKEKRLWQIR